MSCEKPCGNDVPFSIRRLAKCHYCDCKDGDTCKIVESKYPGKSSIQNGINRPELRCPKTVPEWVEEPTTCTGCERTSTIVDTSLLCFYCRNDRALELKNQRRSQLPHKASSASGMSSKVKAVAIDHKPSMALTLPSEMSAVWVYWAGGAEGDELRYSMRSAMANMSDLKNVVLCGDKPDWFAGDFIDSPRFTGAMAQAKFGSPRWCKWVDSIVKLMRIIASDLVTEDFLWLYDDTFIVRPTTINTLSRPRHIGDLYPFGDDRPAAKSWQECRRRTRNALIAAGLPARNYSSHYPVVFNKQRLRETIELFDPMNNPRLIESLYLNHHGTDSTRIGNDFQYSKRTASGWSVNRAATVVNVGGFKRPVAEAIGKLFDVACEVER